MTTHCLAITEGGYDSSTVHGIYASLAEAQTDINRRMLLPDWWASTVEVQEWSGGTRGKERWEPLGKWPEWTCLG